MGSGVATADADKSFEGVLASGLKRVDDYLRFAEAKNAALLTFASAWALATFTLISSGRAAPFASEGCLSISLALLLCAALCAVSSFFPRTSLPWFLGGKRAGPHALNLTYFGDIATLTTRDFEAKVRDRYRPGEVGGPTAEYLSDVAVQIAVISQITTYKLRIFKLGTALLALAIIVLIFSVSAHMLSTLYPT